MLPSLGVNGAPSVAEDGNNNMNQHMQAFLPDPMDINDFNMTDHGVLTAFKGQFSVMQLRGMQKLKIESTKFNLQ